MSLAESNYAIHLYTFLLNLIFEGGLQKIARLLERSVFVPPKITEVELTGVQFSPKEKRTIQHHGRVLERLIFR